MYPPKSYGKPKNAQELLDRYAAGDRYFGDANLANENLSGADLSGANLHHVYATFADFRKNFA